MDEFDSPWKEVLDAYLPECLELLFPHVNAVVDWTKEVKPLESQLRQLLPDSEMGLATADKLVQVSCLDGRDEILLLHVEVQNQPRPGFPERMFHYFTQIWRHFGRPPVSLAILGDDRPSFRPGEFEYDRLGCGVRFQFLSAKILDFKGQRLELEKSQNRFAHVLLTHLATLATKANPAARHAEKVRLLRRMFEQGRSAEDIRNLYRFVDWLMSLPPGLDVEFRREALEIEKEYSMPYVTSIERLAKEEGRVETLLNNINIAFCSRFPDGGDNPFLDLGSRSVAELEQILAMICSAKSLHELKDRVSQQSPPGR